MFLFFPRFSFNYMFFSDEITCKEKPSKIESAFLPRNSSVELRT